MGEFNKVTGDKDTLNNLGPLSLLAGIWEGDEGIDVAPGRNGPVETRYRERLVLEPIGPIINGPQRLYGLKYSMLALPFTHK